MARLIGLLVSAGVASLVAYSMTQGYTYEEWRPVDWTVISFGGGLGIGLFAAYEETHLPGWVTTLALGPAVVFFLGGPADFFYFSASTAAARPRGRYTAPREALDWR